MIVPPISCLLILLLTLQGKTTNSPNCSSKANTLIVEHTANDGVGSLRQAVLNAINGDTIRFSPSTNEQPIRLNSAIILHKDLVIIGNGVYKTIIDAQQRDRIFVIPATTEVAISYLNLINGKSANHAGGIENYGILTLNSCQISGNQSATKGGGVYSDSLARLVIINSIISGNLARDGGGIYSRSSIVEIINSTFSGNSATENGGGYYVYGGTLDIGNTILALNNSGNDGADVYKKGNGNVVICNFNLVGDATGLETVISEGTITNLDPLFQQEVPTAPSTEGNLSLQKCSPAVNSGNNILPPLGLSKDIAGNARKVDAFIDLGAF